MLSKIEEWIVSRDNIFLRYGCEFDISRPPRESDTKSITVDFELNNYFCRLIFWESGQGHMEVLDIDSEETFLGRGFDIQEAFSKYIPFEDVLLQLTS